VKKRFSEEQIIGFLREAEAGMPFKDLCRQHGFSEASYCLWRSKFGGSVPDARRLKELEAENTRLKKLLAEQVFEEVKRVQLSLDFYMLDKKPDFLIGDGAYDSDKMDGELREEGIKMVAPHKKNRKKAKTRGRA